VTISQVDYRILTVQPEPLTIEDFQKISKLSYVSSFDFNIYTHANSLFSKELNRYWNPEWGIEDEYSLTNFNQNILQGSATEHEHFSLRGVNNLELMDIQAGLLTLVQGRTFIAGEENAALISQSLADINNLSLGSTLEFENIVFDARNFWAFDYAYMLDNLIFASETIELTVVGIFEISGEVRQSLNPLQSGEQEVLNRIYVPLTLVEQMHPFQIEHAIYLYGSPQDLEVDFTSIFLLNDPRDMPYFAESANEILPYGWQIYYLDNNFEQMIIAMDSMRWIADSILLFTSGATFVTLALLIIIFIKDRRTEIGIYLSLGEKKHKILSQILLEVLSIAIFSLFLSFFSGNQLSGLLSSHLLQQDIQQQLEEETTDFRVDFVPHLPQLANFDPGEMSMEEMLEAFDTSLTVETMLTFFVVGTGIILSATIVPIIYTMKLNPKEIML